MTQNDLIASIQQQNGQLCCFFMKQLLDNPDRASISNIQSKVHNLPGNWSEFIQSFIRHVTNLMNSVDHAKLFDEFNCIFGSFIPLFDTAWQRFILKALCSHLLSLGLKADEKRLAAGITKNDVSHLYVLKARSRVDTLLNKIMNDRFGNPDAKTGMFILVNYNLRSLLLLKELSLGPKVIEQIENQIQRGEYLDYFSSAQKVTYNYYVGIIRLYNHEFSRADRHLTFAFNNCPDKYFKNKVLLLRILIVTRMVRGCLPSNDLLLQYNLSSEFGPLVESIQQGNFQGYHEHLELLKPWLISFDCYCILKYRLEVMFLRTLVMRSFSILQDNKIEYVTLLKAFHLAGFLPRQILDEIDVEGALVTLIDEGLVKGYLVHGKKLLVLAKTEPFPNPYQVHQKRFGKTDMTY